MPSTMSKTSVQHHEKLNLLPPYPKNICSGSISIVRADINV